ncbi:MAG TPA: hypothetical protein PK413_01720 [Thermoanaerobaculia bacterium]|nr:hypothetical protein [Thermoanaerobaculia bacterium]
MVTIPQLWMPIVVGAVLVFVVSALMHMVLTYHRKDYKQLPDEAANLEPLRQAGLSPGLYTFPYCHNAKEMNTPEFAERYRKGPVGFLTVLPNAQPNLGKFLGQWFGYCLLVSIFAAYLAGRTLGIGVPYLTVFRVVGTAAFMAFGLGEVVNSIWRGMPWGNTCRALFDGFVYALMMAGAFGWLWPR